MLWLLANACSPSEPALPEVRVRRGVVRATGPGRPLADGRFLADDPGDGLVACIRLFSVDLPAPGDLVALGGASPDTALAFSPDGERLLVGATGGVVLVLDAWSGEVLARRALAETAVRAVAWSADGGRVWAAEQSPDAAVLALDPSDLATVASYDLAAEVGTAAPAPDDLYGLYQLPSVSGLHPLPDGSVLALGTHGWDTPEGRRNASRVLRLRVEGDRLVPVAAWPAEGAADVVLGASDLRGQRLGIALRRSASGPAPTELPVDGVLELSLPDLRVTDAIRFAPTPGFDQVFVWDALALVDGGLVVGTGDGRVIAHVGGEERETALGAPRDPALPIAASVGFLRSVGADVWAVTSRSWAPGSTDPETRPGRLHPDERVVARFHREGATLVERNLYRSPYDVGGIAVGPAEVAVAAGPRQDARTDLFGALVFDVAGGDPVVCATEGPAYHALALAPDGRVAVAEVPWLDGGSVRGGYRVTVLR
ncbi:MAG: hypothetical protein H6738_05435 [Alphaproteobacteria bacterium]|nr:hypothetical protein [Alphaproteobacteria bacterium]MCB9696210.1 hypothetical protein [Alphaproteobacteria bacterium]